jgi:hypothetical protein
MSAEELNDMVFFFDSDPAGIGGEVERQLKEQIDRWKAQREGSTLTLHYSDEGVTITDRRRGWHEREHVFVAQDEIAVLELLLEPQSLASLERALEARMPAAPRTNLPHFLDRLIADGLIFEQAGKFVQIATRFDPSNIRLDGCLASEAA